MVFLLRFTSPSQPKNGNLILDGRFEISEPEDNEWKWVVHVGEKCFHRASTETKPSVYVGDNIEYDLESSPICYERLSLLEIPLKVKVLLFTLVDPACPRVMWCDNYRIKKNKNTIRSKYVSQYKPIRCPYQNGQSEWFRSDQSEKRDEEPLLLLSKT